MTHLLPAHLPLRLPECALSQSEPGEERSDWYIKNTFLLHPDVLDDILAEDEGVGHDSTEDEHDAGEDPDGKSRYSLDEEIVMSVRHLTVLM